MWSIKTFKIFSLCCFFIFLKTLSFDFFFFYLLEHLGFGLFIDGAGAPILIHTTWSCEGIVISLLVLFLCPLGWLLKFVLYITGLFF